LTQDCLFLFVPAGSVEDDPALPLWEPKARSGKKPVIYCTP